MRHIIVMYLSVSVCVSIIVVVFVCFLAFAASITK